LVAIIIGIEALLRPKELHSLSFSDVVVNDAKKSFCKCNKEITVNVSKLKTSANDSENIYFILNSKTNCKVCKILIYIDLVKNSDIEKFKKDNFFKKINNNNKVCDEVIGINNFYSIPRNVAKLLNFPNYEDYSGYTLRRTGATNCASSGFTDNELMAQGNWKSSTVMRGYIDKGEYLRRKLAEKRRGSLDKENIKPIDNIYINKKSKKSNSSNGSNGTSSTVFNGSVGLVIQNLNVSSMNDLNKFKLQKKKIKVINDDVSSDEEIIYENNIKEEKLKVQEKEEKASNDMVFEMFDNILNSYSDQIWLDSFNEEELEKIGNEKKEN